MATIRTAVQVHDMMSQQFHAMNMAMATVIDSFQTLQDTTSNAIDVSALEIAQRELQQVEASYNQIEQEIKQAEQAQENFNRDIQKADDVASKFLGTLGTIVGTYATVQGLINAVKLSDEMVNVASRLELINDGLYTTAELQQMIFESAQRTYAPYQQTADMVGKLGIQARNAFADSAEIVAFAEQINKIFTIAGTSAQGVESVMLQLTQAMASGKLQGEELSAILDNAQPIVANIQRYLEEAMNIDASNIKQLASEGVITAEIIKNAMFYTAAETNKAFENMDITWSDLWTKFQNNALKSFEPVLQKINDLANSEKVQDFVSKATHALYILADTTLWILQLISSISSFIYDNWSDIAPLFYGLATAVGVYAVAIGIQTAATWLSVEAHKALIVTMLKNPILWVALAIGVLISIIYKWIQSVGGIEIAWKIAMNGILKALDWVKIGFFTGLYWIMNMWDRFLLGTKVASVGLQNIIGDMKVNALMILQNMVNEGINIINDFINKLNMIPGVSIDLVDQVTFGTTAQIGNEIAKNSREYELNNFRNHVEGVIAYRNAMLDQMKLEARNATAQRLAEIEAMQAQATTENNDNSFDYSSVLNDLILAAKDTAGNTKKMADHVSMSAEDIKYLRDISEREAINRYTTGNITIEMKNENHINSELDIDGVIDRFGERVEEVAEMLAEGNVLVDV